MKLEWLILADGIGQDSRGAFTLIGVNQNVFAPAVLPASTRRVLIAHLTDDGSAHEVGELTFRISVTGPSGDVLMANQGKAMLGGTIPWPDLPATYDIPFDIALTYGEYGAYRFEVGAQTPKGETMESNVIFFVQQPVATA